MYAGAGRRGITSWHIINASPHRPVSIEGDRGLNPNTQAMPRNMTALLAVLLLQLLVPAASRAEDPKDYQALLIRTVFSRLTAAIGGASHSQPKLEIVAMDEAAGYDRRGSTISVDEHLFDLCRGMGPDSINALATVISHELAHYYLGHGWFDGIERKDQRARLHRDLQWRINRESEADFYGGIYRHLAGYDSYVTASVMEMLYEHYQYSDSSPEYLPLDQRKDIAITVDDSLRSLIPAFDASTCLTLARRYGIAQQCYDYLIARFPSREMFNNAGVAYALQAVALVGGEGSRFTYPFELDEDTRLSDVKLDKGWRTGRTRSPSPSDSLRVVQLLDSAAARFEMAAAKDSTYAPALINLASVRLLQERFGDASMLVDRAKMLDTALRTRLLTLIVGAIAEARKGGKDRARQGLKEIIGIVGAGDAGALAQVNLAAVDSVSYAPPSGGRIISIEQIEGFRAGDTALMAHWKCRNVVGGDSALLVVDRQLSYSEVLRVETRSTWIQFISAGSLYPGATTKGIRLGSTLADVREAYSFASRTVNARQGRYIIYDYPRIIFLIDDNDRVIRWMIFDTGERH
jgi:hypothetical protein